MLGLGRGHPPRPSPPPAANLCNHFTTSCRVSWARRQRGSAQLRGLGGQPSWREPRARVSSGKEESLLMWLSSWICPTWASPLLSPAPTPCPQIHAPHRCPLPPHAGPPNMVTSPVLTPAPCRYPRSTHLTAAHPQPHVSPPFGEGDNPCFTRRDLPDAPYSCHWFVQGGFLATLKFLYFFFFFFMAAFFFQVGRTLSMTAF